MKITKVSAQAVGVVIPGPQARHLEETGFLCELKPTKDLWV